MVARTRSVRNAAVMGDRLRTRARRGFTLMELMTVVVILGILIAIITFAVLWVIEAAERAAFASNLRSFANAAHMYRTEYGYYPDDAAPGELPEGFAKYIDPDKWTESTPFGGKWDITSGGGEHGTQFGIGVTLTHGEVDDDENVMREQDAMMGDLDEEIDDGDINTGSFRRLEPGSYYLVIAE